MILLFPEPRETARWQPTEAPFVRKAIDQVVNRFEVGDQRVAVFGEESGGAMAYLVGLRNRDVVRGIATVDAPLPGRLGGIENEPLQRLAILVASTPGSPLAERVQEGTLKFQELKFPVTEVRREVSDATLTDDERSLIGRWVDSLDRL